MKEDADADPAATRDMLTPSRISVADGLHNPDGTSGSGRLEVRCPNCHAPTEVAVDTSLTDLTCGSCGSHFSLVDQSKATRMAPSLSKLGRFELIERLGVGGFGSVWKARDKELDRTVAIKIPRAGAMTGVEQEQFFREARAAAQLRHPSIVSVHEVGRDGDSVYIVSDFVRGATLGDWLTGQQLTSREAAELCAKIADALHHAHEQGVVHRDLKPANIMMDGDNQPHLMDFGLARREIGEVTVTVDGQVLGTPAYMSPEQARGEAHTADRRSDVYSLGVILFQLLTDELPFRGNARMLIKQVIDDEPSSPRKLNSNVAKDLETITLKCMEKSPDRRYQDAADLAQELRRFLTNEPIQARPISRIERTLRWAKRRPASAALLAALLFGAFGFAAAFLRERDLRHEVVAEKNEAERQRIEADSQRAKAEAERDNAQAVVKFLTKDVLAKASPVETPDKTVRDALVKALIEPSAAVVGERFKDRPLSEAAVRDTLGEILRILGRADLALPHIKTALEQRHKLLGLSHPDTMGSLENFIYVLRTSKEVQEAEPLVEQAMKESRTRFGDEHEVTLRAENLYAQVLIMLDRTQEAEPIIKQSLDISSKVLRGDDPITIESQLNYADFLIAQDRTQEAEPIIKRWLESNRKRYGEENLRTIWSLSGYARVLHRLGRNVEAKKLIKEVLEKQRRILGDEHPYTMMTMRELATILGATGQFEEASQLNKQALKQGFFTAALVTAKLQQEMLNRTVEAAVNYRGEASPQPIDSLVLGELRLIAGKFDSAEVAIRGAIQKGGIEPYFQKSLGWCLLAQGKVDNARQAFQEVLKDRRRKDGTFDLDKADRDQMTAAYFLDLVTEQAYAEHFAPDKKLACFPWFYVAQRREIEGKKDAAIKAYERCVELGKVDNPHTVRALAEWKLQKLKEPPKADQK